MAGINASLNIARNAIAAQQYGISVAGHNISNVNTENYSRQSVLLTSSSQSSTGGFVFGTGVHLQQVQQTSDQMLEKRLMDARSDFSATDEVQSYMTIMETIFDENADNSLSSLIGEFWNSWQDLADNPEGTAGKSIITEKGRSLATTFDALKSSMEQMEEEIDQKLEAAVNEINTITSEIAALNMDISAGEASGSGANDLRDKRNALVTDLSERLNVQSYEQKNGALTVATANGCTLVNEFDMRPLTVSEGRIQSKGSSSGMVDITDQISGGQISGLLDMRDEVLPKYTAQLDELAHELIWNINHAHSQGVGAEFFSSPMEGAYATETDGALSTLTYGDRIDYTKSFKMWIEDSGTSPAEMTPVEVDLSISSVSAELQGTGEVSSQYRFTVLKGGDVDTDSPVIAWQRTKPDGTVTDGQFTVTGSGSNNITTPPPASPEDTLSLDLGTGTVIAGNTFTVNTSDTGVPDPLQFIPKGTANSINDTYTFKVVSGGKLGTVPAADSDPVTIYWSNSLTSGTFELEETNPAIPETVDVDGMQLTFSGGMVFEDDVFTVQTDQNGNPVELPTDPSEPIPTPGYLPSNWQWTLDSFSGRFNEEVYGKGVQAEVTSDNTLKFFPEPNGYEPINFNYSGTNGFIADNATVSIADYTQMTIPTPDNAPLRLDWDFDTSTWSISGNPGYGGLIVSGDPTSATDPRVELDFDGDSNVDMTFELKEPVVDEGWIEFDIKPDEIGDYRFAFSDDQHEDAGLTAALGLNTFFIGNDANSIDVHSVLDELAYVGVSQVDGTSGTYAAGDNRNAIAITDLQYTVWSMKKWNFERGTDAGSFLIQGSIETYCHTMIGEIGVEAQNLERDKEHFEVVMNQIRSQREGLSGVSLDEEMINLVKYQQAYTAAAKLLTTLDEMLTTLIQTA
jgi:flagellar hook-associated protein FlgK